LFVPGLERRNGNPADEMLPSNAGTILGCQALVPNPFGVNHGRHTRGALAETPGAIDANATGVAPCGAKGFFDCRDDILCTL
jgi:hypothetical protein